MIPLLLPLVTNLAPPLVSWLFGDKAAKVAGQVAGAVQDVTGADPATAAGAAAATAILQGKPELAAQLQTQLLTIHAQMQAEADQAAQQARQAELDTLRAQLADLAGARQQTVDLAKAGSDIAWAAPILSAVILVAFGVMLFVVLTRSIPAGSTDLANVLLGTLAAMATQVPNYWLGSSSGSARKDIALARKG